MPPYDFSLAELESSDEWSQSSPETQRALSREYISENGTDEVLEQFKSAIADPEYQSLPADQQEYFRKSYQDFYGIDLPLEDVSFGTDVKDVVMSGLAGTSAIPKAAATVAGWFGAEDSKQSLLDIAKTTEDFYTSQISQQGKDVQAQPFLSDEDGKWFDDNAIKKVFMVSSESLPLMIATAPLGGGASAAISKAKFLPEFIRAVEGGSKVGKWSHNLITFGASEAGTSALVSAADAGERIEKMPEQTLRKSPVYQELLKQGMDPATARAELRGIVEEETVKTQFAATLAGGAVAPGGAMPKLFQKGALKQGVLRETVEGIGKESVQEGLQSPTEQFGENVVTRRNLDPNQSLSENTGEAAALGFASGGMMGGTMGGGSKLLSLGQAQQIAQDVPLGADPEQVAAQIETATNPTGAPNITLGELTPDEIEGIAAVQARYAGADLAEVQRVQRDVLPMLREKNPMVAPHVERIINERFKVLQAEQARAFEQQVPAAEANLAGMQPDLAADDLMDDWADSEMDIQAQADARGRSVRFEQLKQRLADRYVAADELEANRTGRSSTAEESAAVLAEAGPSEVEQRAARQGDIETAFAESEADDLVNTWADDAVTLQAGEDVRRVENPPEPVIEGGQNGTGTIEETSKINGGASDSGTVLPADTDGVKIIAVKPFEEAQQYDVYTTSIKDRGEMFAVRGDMPRGGGDRIFGTLEEAQKYSEEKKVRDESNAVFRQKEEAEQRVRDEKESADRAAREDLDEFDSSMTPMQRGRVLSALSKQVNYGGRVLTKRDLIRDRVNAGYTVDEDGNLADPDGSFLGPNVLTKTGIDYARHLIERQNTPGPTAESAPAPNTAASLLAGETRGVPPGPSSSRSGKPTAESIAADQPVNTEPTPAQAEAGNYQKAHVTIDGLNLSIENPVGSTRRGTDATGRAWSQDLTADYGYIKGTRGRDKDHVDIFVKPGYTGGAADVFVVNQYKPDDTFDEHKTVVGPTTEQEALQLYQSNYESGWTGGRSVTRVPMEAFRKWVSGHGPSKGPLVRRGTVTDQDVARQKFAEKVRKDNAGRPETVQGSTAKSERDLRGKTTESEPVLARDGGYKYRVGIASALSKYGAEIDNEGFIIKGTKKLSVQASVKNGRIRFKSGDKLLGSGPNEEKTVENFVEKFWFWKKVEIESDTETKRAEREKTRAAEERKRRDLRARFDNVISGLTGKFKKTEYSRQMPEGKTESATAMVYGSFGFEKIGKGYNVVHPETGFAVDAFDSVADARSYILAADYLGIAGKTVEKLKPHVDTLRNLSFAFNRDSTPNEDLVKRLEAVKPSGPGGGKPSPEPAIEKTVIVDGKKYRPTGTSTSVNGKQVGNWEFEYKGQWLPVKSVQQRIKADSVAGLDDTLEAAAPEEVTHVVQRARRPPEPTGSGLDDTLESTIGDTNDRPTEKTERPTPETGRGLRENSPTFRRWFGASKITDQGTPVILYHGTSDPDFLSKTWTFDLNRPARPGSSPLAALGAFLGDETIADAHSVGTEGTTHAFYVRMENPYVVQSDRLERVVVDSETARALRTRLIAEGYDGLIIEDRAQVVIFDPNQVKSAERNSGAYSREIDSVLEAAAYHGSPHSFDKFSTAAIGTGEGAQAYGHGLYFAGKREVADHYRTTLSGSARRLLDASFSADPELWVAGQLFSGIKPADIIDGLKILEYNGDPKKLLEDGKKRLAREKSASGKLYQVELAPAEDEYLLWDRPLSEQSEKVKAALENGEVQKIHDDVNSNLRIENPTGSDLYDALDRHNFSKGREDSEKAASEYLHSLGIRGIKYLDGTSRGKGDGNFNYVIFNDADVSITDILESPTTRREFIKQGGALIAWAAAGGDIVTAAPRPFNEAVRTDGQTVHGLLENIRDNSTSERFRTMAEDLLTLLPDPDRLSLTVTDTRTNAAGIAKTDRAGKRIGITLYGDGHNEATLLHESWHAAVLARYDMLNYYLANPGKLGNHQAEAALKQYRAVWEEFGEAVRAYGRGRTDLPVWLRVPAENPDEFLTYALTHPETIDWMSEREYRGKTLRERFLAAIRGFFARMFARRPTWLEAANMAAGDLVEAMRKDAPNFEASARVLALAGKSGGSVENVAHQSLESTLYAQSPTTTQPDAIDRFLAKHPNLSDQWERFLYSAIDKDDPRRRVLKRADVVNLSENLSENTDILTIERLRGKKTADEAEQFMKTTAEPLLAGLARAKLAPADLDEYAHAKHAPERNKRMQQVNAKRFIDMAAAHLNSAERAALEERLIDIRSDVLMTGGTRADRQDRYLEVLDDLFTGIATQRADVATRQTELSQRIFTAAEVLKGTPDNLQKRLDARSKHLDEIEAVRDRWELESPRFAGITDAEANDIVNRWTADPRFQALTVAHQQLLDLGQLKLDILRESGQLSDVEYRSLVDGYEFYVPLHRDIEDDTRPATGRVTGPTGSPIKVAKGSMLEVVHILAHSIQNVQTAITRKHKADAGRVLVNFARENPDAGITVGKQAKNPTHDADGNIVMYTAPREADNELYIRVDGERFTLTFDTKNPTTNRFLESIKNADANLSGPMAALSKMIRILAMVNTTLSPEFVLSNFTRDIQTAGVHMEDTEARGLQGRVLKNVFPAIRGILGAEYGKAGTYWGKVYRDFAANGGKIGWMQSYDGIKDLAKQIESTMDLYRDGHIPKKSLRVIGDAISRTNTAVENGVRLAFYDQMIKSGATPSRAALTASNLTVDFTRRGADSPAINALYMFFNAGVQSNVRMIKAVSRSPRVRVIVGGIVVTGATLQLLAYATGGDDETGEPFVDGIPDFIRERNMIIMIPDSGGKFAKIPMPYGYNLFYNVGAEIVRGFHTAATGRKYDAAKAAMRTVTMALNSFNPLQSATVTQALAPTVVDPFVMVGENKTWSGSDLMPKESPFGPGKADAYRYWKSTSGIAKNIAQGLHRLTGGQGEYDNTAAVDISPEVIELMYETVTGSAGRFLKDSVVTPIQAITGDEPVEPAKIPFARRVYGQWSNRSISERYYESADQVERFRQNYLAADADTRKKMASDPRYKMVSLVKDAESTLTKLREARNKAEATGRPTKLIEEKIVNVQTEYLKRSKKWEN